MAKVAKCKRCDKENLIVKGLCASCYNSTGKYAKSEKSRITRLNYRQQPEIKERYNAYYTKYWQNHPDKYEEHKRKMAIAARIRRKIIRNN
jgi:hypothetical protein